MTIQLEEVLDSHRNFKEEDFKSQGRAPGGNARMLVFH
jgi:hypothetical protein